MAMTFHSTMRSLEADHGKRGRLSAMVALGCLGAWGVWLAAAQVDLHEVSTAARVEVGDAAHPAEAAAGGRVLQVHVELGAEVRQGDALVVLDSGALRAERDELRAQHDAIGPQLDAARRELEAHQRMLDAMQGESRSVVREARARWREAEAGARFSTEEARRLSLMHDRELSSELDASRAMATAERERAEEQALEIAVVREGDEQRVRERAQEIEIARLDRQIADLAGQAVTLAAALARIDRQIEEHTIRAPIDGRVGEIEPLRRGSYVELGARVATIVPVGQLRAVAEFAASEANGRLRAGQTARMLFDGYPAVEFGQLEATVLSVGNEARDGRIRVELRMASERLAGIPLEHGMTGTVRVRVERATPLSLMARALGRALIPSRTAS